jgi:hypothetical protein
MRHSRLQTLFTCCGRSVLGLYKTACEVAANVPQNDHLHPIRYVAAALFASGQVKVVRFCCVLCAVYEI